MIKTELDKLLEDAEAAQNASTMKWYQADNLLTSNMIKEDATHIANCSPANIKWMGERIKELEEGLAEAYREIRRINGTPADP